jgi:hypothetical protein
LTLSFRVSGRGINLALAPQTPNFYPICVGSSKSLRHLTHSIWVQCPDLCPPNLHCKRWHYEETEAVHWGGRATLRPRSHVMKGPCKMTPAPPRPALVAGTRFSLQLCPTRLQLNFGQTRAPVFLVANEWPFPRWTPVSLFSWVTQHHRLTVIPLLAQYLKMGSPTGFTLTDFSSENRRDQRIPRSPPPLLTQL